MSVSWSRTEAAQNKEIASTLRYAADRPLRNLTVSLGQNVPLRGLGARGEGGRERVVQSEGS